MLQEPEAPLPGLSLTRSAHDSPTTPKVGMPPVRLDDVPVGRDQRCACHEAAAAATSCRTRRLFAAILSAAACASTQVG